MGPKLGYCRNPQTTAQFIKQFYKEVQVSPQEVEYVEAYGTGKSIINTKKKQLKLKLKIFISIRPFQALLNCQRTRKIII